MGRDFWRCAIGFLIGPESDHFLVLSVLKPTWTLKKKLKPGSFTSTLYANFNVVVEKLGFIVVLTKIFFLHQSLPVLVGILHVRKIILRRHSVLKGGGAKKMLQTAKTFVTKLVRYIEWIVDPLRGHQFYLIWYCYGQKRPFFWPKPPFLAMRGSRRPRWLAKVDQMVDHS